MSPLYLLHLSNTQFYCHLQRNHKKPCDAGQDEFIGSYKLCRQNKKGRRDNPKANLGRKPYRENNEGRQSYKNQGWEKTLLKTRRRRTNSERRETTLDSQITLNFQITLRFTGL
jgi:hypothetical protein